MDGLESIQRGVTETLELVRVQGDRLRDLEQKSDRRHAGDGGGAESRMEIAEKIHKSDGYAAFQKGMVHAYEVAIERKALILSPVTPNNDQPLVQADRRPDLVKPLERRLTIRDLLPVFMTTSNVVEYPRELLFTNAAAPQYDSSSPDATREGALKAESSLTFELVNAPVITIAHTIPVSRQIWDDAPQLEQLIKDRMIYGLKLKEETEIISGTGASGGLSGLIANATTFTGGATNQSAIDTLAKAILQLQLGDYSPTVVILNPSAWLSSSFALAKSTTNEYLLSNPASMPTPRLFDLPVILSNSMPVGKFLMLDTTRCAAIFDRESVVVRVGTVADDFQRNILRVLVESRLALAIKQAGAIIYGDLSYTG